MKWNDAFQLAERYYGEHGDLLVPLEYVSDGYSLGRWIEWQRRRHSAAMKLEGEDETMRRHKSVTSLSVKHYEESCVSAKEQQRGGSSDPVKQKSRRSSCTPLTEEQISRLDSIGMVWNLADYAWERSFAAAEAYYKEHGNLVVPTDYCVDGVNISSWIRTQRRIQNGALGKRKNQLTDEQVRRLESIGMTWEPYGARWEHSFAVAEKYYREHGDLNVPSHYEKDGVDLSRWLWLQRQMVNGKDGGTAKKPTQEQIRRLSAIGMEWEPKPKPKGFYYYYRLAKRFYEAYGHTDFPMGEVSVDGELLPESGETLAAWKTEQEKETCVDGKAKGGWSWQKRTLLLEIGIGGSK